MKVKKIPSRLCTGCNEKKSKQELIRIVKNKEGEIFLDTTGKKPGRGAYICPKGECFEKAYKTKRIERNLESKLEEELYAKIKEEISNGC